MSEPIYDGGNPLASSLALFIFQVILIVFVSKLLGFFFHYVKQPSVIAEVITGILLGPSVMGFVPGFTENIFPPSSMETFDVIANIGLILFMFIIGLEVDPAHVRRNCKGSFVISLSAMALPFGLGIAASVFIYNELPMSENATFPTFLLFIGVAVSITAMPVLARILTDLNLTHTKVGVVSLSSAAVDDVTAWILLALVVSLARSPGSLVALYTLLVFFGYVLVMMVVLRPILSWISKVVHSHEAKKQEFVILILLLLFISAWTTDVIGVHSIFGGFFMGLITPRNDGFAIRLAERIEDLTMIILIPLYFTYSGLRSNLTSINSWQAGVTILLAIAVSMLGKIGGGTIASRIMRHSWRDSLTIGFLLNTKGLVELVALNVGLDIGVLSDQVFSAFIVMALWNTIITTPVVWLLTRKEKKNHSMSASSDYSVLVCIQDPKLGISMVTFAGALVKSKQKPCIHAVHLKEVSERPSTYIFNMKLEKLDAVEFARQRAAVLNVNFRIITRSSANISVDLAKIANSRVPTDLVILGWNKRHHDDFGEGSRKIDYFMKHIHAPIGIFVDNGQLRNRTNVPRILLIYSFQPFEMEAAKVALTIAHDLDVHVTIIVPRQEEPISRYELNQQAIHFEPSSSTIASTSSKKKTESRSHKKISWYHYFDILFLLLRLVQIIKRCIRQKSDHEDNTKNETPAEKNADMEMDEVVEMEEQKRGAESSTSIRLSQEQLPKSRVLEASAEADRKSITATEEEMMSSYEGIQLLVHSKANMSLILSENLFQEALEQEATHVYQMIIIGNKRKCNTQQPFYHLNLDHYRPPSFFDSDEEDHEACSEHGESAPQLNDIAKLSATSLLVVHPALHSGDCLE